MSSAQEDFEAVIADEEEAALKWRRASTALDELRRDDPEAAEVIRRRRGLDGLGEEEALESIAATGLTCTGRSIGRESVRQIQKRGEAVLRRRAIEPRAS
jgi:DNA-directed RNA polymerase sigma subunit (sigma70/sigma32)